MHNMTCTYLMQWTSCICEIATHVCLLQKLETDSHVVRELIHHNRQNTQPTRRSIYSGEELSNNRCTDSKLTKQNQLEWFQTDEKLQVNQFHNNRLITIHPSNCNWNFIVLHMHVTYAKGNGRERQNWECLSIQFQSIIKAMTYLQTHCHCFILSDYEVLQHRLASMTSSLTGIQIGLLEIIYFTWHCRTK